MLTPHAVAIDRAANAVAKLDDYLEGARASGVLAAFNSEFERRRVAAAAEVRGFMSY